MQRRLSSVSIACCALALVSGCGSSGNSANGTSGTSTGSATTKTGTASSLNGSAASLKVESAPKFASPSPSAPVQSGLVQIAYRNIAIDPDTVKVKVGSTLKWTDYDDVTHNVISQSGPSKFASSNLKEGSTFSYKVTKPGVIHYECTYHPASMNGTIEVVK